MLVGNPHRLPSGLRVRLRLPGPAAAAGVRDLLGRLGLAADELELHRAVRVHPRQALVIATALIAGRERVIGLAGPGLVLADEALAPGLTSLLQAAVAERALAA